MEDFRYELMQRTAMKILIIIILMTIASALYSQTYMERRISNMSPIWANGMNLEEMIMDKCNGRYVCKISEGTFYKLHREHICADIIYKKVDVVDVIYDEKVLLIWVEKGEIKSSFGGIKSKNSRDIFMLWKVNITVLNGKIQSTDIIDFRGLSIENLFNGIY